MIRPPLATLSFLLALGAAAPPARAELATGADFQRVCDEFYKIDLDTARVHDIANATLTRDIGTIRMTKGVLLFSQAIEGVTPMAVFLGEGTFTLTPVSKMDRDMLDIAARDHLKKNLGGMVNTKITEALFIAYDKAFDEIRPSLSPPRPPAAEELSRARQVLKGRLEILDLNGAPEFGLIARALSESELSAQDKQEAAFHAELNSADHGWLLYSWAPSATYEVRLGLREPIGAFFYYHPLITAHKKADLDPTGRYVADPTLDLHAAIKVKHYRMDLEIPDIQQINIDVDVTFAPVIDGMRLLAFNLVNDIQGPRWNSRAKWIDVKSIKDTSGTDLPFLHRKNIVLVLLKERAEKDKDVTLSFTLNENTITQLSNVHYSLLNTYAWFPQYGYLGGQYEIDWTVKTVKPLTATGSGKVIKAWEEENFNAIQMIFEQPVQFPSLIFGRFKEESTAYDSAAATKKIDLATHFWPKTVFAITDPDFCKDHQCPIPFELDVPAAKPKEVLDEGKAIIKFMENLYGPFPYDKLDVAMMSPFLGFGQSPPAFVQLTGEAFMSSNTLDQLGVARLNFFHGFYSHEIAHQWWGHKIGWISDEDVWLSESFAEYSAGLYVLSYLGKPAFREKMEGWKALAKIADAHGSIAWANNVSGQTAGLYRTGLIYDKGPYVVHMLRMQMGLENFKKAMQSVFTKYGHTNISTDQLKRECEMVVGYKLDYFFDQWFRGTGIPVFDYSWTSEPQGDGKHLVTIKISQRDKENFKQVLMPVFFHFKGQKDPLIKARPVLKAEDTYQIKLPEKPTRIALDEDHDILGDMIPQGSAAGQ